MKNKLLRKQALLLATSLTLGITSLTGCTNTNTSYTRNINNITETGSIKYKDIKKAKLIKVTNESTNEEEYHLVVLNQDKEKNIFSYQDIETGNTIYNNNKNVVVILDDITDYLKKYNLIQEEYNLDDIETIIQNLLSDETIINQKSISKKLTLKRHYC